MPTDRRCEWCDSRDHYTRDCRDEELNETRIELYHSGWDAHRGGQPRPADADQAAGWDDRADAIRVQVVPVERPEGYYHAPLGAFD